MVKGQNTDANEVNSITKNQHTLPVASLKRFCNSDGLLHVRIQKEQKTVRLKPSNKIFTVNQHWDQFAEAGHGKLIEDQFQNIAEDLISRSRQLTESENVILLKFYLLWSIRTRITKYDSSTTNMLQGSSFPNLTEEQMIEIELSKGIYALPDGTVPWRFIRGGAMKQAIDKFYPRLMNIPWRLFESQRNEILVPDYPGDSFIIPLTPTKLLSLFTLEFNVERINIEAISRAKRYYCAKDLGKVL